MVCDVAPALLSTPPSCMPPGGARLEYTAASGWVCVCEPGYSGVSCTVGSSFGSPSCAPPPCDPPAGTGTYTFNGSAFKCACSPGYAGAPCAAVAVDAPCGAYPMSQYSPGGVPSPLGATHAICNCTGWSWARGGDVSVVLSTYGFYMTTAVGMVDANQYPGATATLLAASDTSACPLYTASNPSCSLYNYTSVGGTCAPAPGYTPTPWNATCFADLGACQRQCPAYTSPSAYASSTFGTCAFGGTAADSYGTFARGVCSIAASPTAAAAPYFCPMNEFAALRLPGFAAPVVSGFMGYDLAYVAVRSPYECAAICRSFDIACVGFVLVLYDNNMQCGPKTNMGEPSWNSCPTTAGCYGFKLLT